MTHDAAITLDTDWAPDFVIDEVASRLLRGRVRATWFVTHDSPAIDRLRRHPDVFELGIHPNFLPGSTQGTTPEEVLSYCMRIVPGATSMRTHGLVQSTPLLDLVLKQTPVDTDVSLLLPRMTHVRPLEYWWQGRMLLRVPYVWEDDFEIECPVPNWDVHSVLAAPGVKVFDFHPIHVYLNSPDLRSYSMLKQRCPVLANAACEQVTDLVTRGTGAGAAFNALIEALAPDGGRLMSEYRRAWQALAR